MKKNVCTNLLPLRCSEWSEEAACNARQYKSVLCCNRNISLIALICCSQGRSHTVVSSMTHGNFPSTGIYQMLAIAGSDSQTMWSCNEYHRVKFQYFCIESTCHAFSIISWFNHGIESFLAWIVWYKIVSGLNFMNQLFWILPKESAHVRPSPAQWVLLAWDESEYNARPSRNL